MSQDRITVRRWSDRPGHPVQCERCGRSAQRMTLFLAEEGGQELSVCRQCESEIRRREGRRAVVLAICLTLTALAALAGLLMLYVLRELWLDGMIR